MYDEDVLTSRRTHSVLGHEPKRTFVGRRHSTLRREYGAAYLFEAKPLIERYASPAGGLKDDGNSRRRQRQNFLNNHGAHTLALQGRVDSNYLDICDRLAESLFHRLEHAVMYD